MGEAVRYDGGDCLHQLNTEAKSIIQIWQQQGLLLSLCPEVAGGLPVPRPPAEIQGASVKTVDGVDVTTLFEKGAQRALDLCQQFQITIAILKQGSPSCGNSLINDGQFSGQKIVGQGFTARLLESHGIRVYNEFELSQVLEIVTEQ